MQHVVGSQSKFTATKEEFDELDVLKKEMKMSLANYQLFFAN